MASKRIEYIDYLKGLTVVLVVWFHTTLHPSFLDFPFRMPLFFFISGVFFKAYPWDIFWRKKVNQLIIPFIFFLFIALGYDIIRDLTTGQDIVMKLSTAISDVFILHDQNNGLTYNPPLWFIMALIDIQVMLYLLGHVIRKPSTLLLTSFAITVFGELWLQWQPTFFMFGDACAHFFYYVAGGIIGRKFMEMLEDESSGLIQRKIAIWGFAGCIAAFIIEKIAVRFAILPEEFPVWILRFPRICALIPLFIIGMKRIYMYKLLAPLKFFGMNSYIVLGTHWILIREFIEYDIYHRLLDRTPGLFESSLLTLITLGIIALLIVIFNRFIPRLVAKKDTIPVRRPDAFQKETA